MYQPEDCIDHRRRCESACGLKRPSRRAGDIACGKIKPGRALDAPTRQRLDWTPALLDQEHLTNQTQNGPEWRRD